eukprot:TRINITY_DN1391_c0_g1_i1.p1 TRINITY_DN1391_c0_g1~~TRINITY_DN1391_c0_g1_i1.p1  ORF type:complete len:245 (+),score=100.94 TRINITY_DN1391_c0_g1_i1:201-935(+)
MKKQKRALVQQLTSITEGVDGEEYDGSDAATEQAVAQAMLFRKKLQADLALSLQKSRSNRTTTPKKKLRTEGGKICIGHGKDGPCKSAPLEGCDYCWHHSPLDPNSPFVFCQYLHPTKKTKKCNIPVSKSENLLLCNYHKRKITRDAEKGVYHPMYINHKPTPSASPRKNGSGVPGEEEAEEASRAANGAAAGDLGDYENDEADEDEDDDEDDEEDEKNSSINSNPEADSGESDTETNLMIVDP